MAFSRASEMEDILNEHDTGSELSVEVSFTLEDILNERLSQADEDEDDAEGLFEEQNSEDNPATKSQSSKEVDRGSMLKVLEQKEGLIVKRHTRIADTLLSPQLLSRNLQYSTLSNVSKLFDATNTSIVGIGVPCCLSATSRKFLAIGTSLSNIVLFEVGVRLHKLLQPDETVSYGAAVSLDISRDNKYMVCGFANGALTLWDLNYFSIAKTIPSSSGQPITKVAFCSDTYSEFISTDLQGNVFLHTIEKYIWVSVRNKRLLNRTAGVLYHDIRSAVFLNGRWFIALANTEFVLVAALQPTVEVVGRFNRPLDLAHSKIPNVEFNRISKDGDNMDILLVSWGCIINIYQYDNKSRLDQFTLLSTYKHDQAIFGMRSLCDSMLLVYDGTNRLQQLNLCRNENVNCYELPAEMVTQKYYKDKQGKPLKNCSNTFCSCLSTQSKEVFLVGKDRILRGRLYRWNEYVSSLISGRQWRQALKLLIELFDNRLDIFSDKVQISPQTVLLFQDLLLAYARTRLEQLQAQSNRSPTKPVGQNTDRTSEVKQTLEGCIEFCLHCNLEQFLFGQLHDKLSAQFSVGEQFLICLEPFIENDLIRRIPNRRVYEAIIEYYACWRAELVDRLVTHLDRDSIDYALTVELCMRLQLYYSLVFVSELNEDFITPANRLLLAAEKPEKQAECLQLLYNMVLLVGKGKSITGADLSEKLTKTGVRVLLQWCLLEETYNSLLSINSSKYFSVLSQFMSAEGTVESIDELNGIDIFSCIEKLRQTLVHDHREDQLCELSACLIHTNKQWTMDLETRMFCLEHIHPKQNMDDLAQFISRNYEFLKLLPKWSEVSEKLPLQIQALTDIEDSNMGLALHKLQNLQLSQQSRKRLFQRIGRYHFSGNIEAMTGIDCYQAAQFLIDQYSPEEISREVDKVRQPFLKYSLVRRVMRLDLSSRVQWDRPLLLFYLESLCLYRTEKRVLHQLKKHIFPMEEALGVVTRHGLLLCQAYLSQPQQAVEIYQRLYRQVFSHNYKRLESFEYSSCRDLKYVFYSLLQLLKGEVMEVTSQHWFQLLETVLQPLRQPAAHSRPNSTFTTADSIQKIYKKKGSDTNPFFTSLFQIIERTLLEVSMHTTIDALTREIQAFLPVISIGFVLNSFRATLQTYDREGHLYRISGKLLLKDMIGNFEQIMTENTNGIASEGQCSGCHNQAFGASSYLFRCGHSFHIKCLDRLKCPLCALEKAQFEPSPERNAVHRQPEHPTTRFSNANEQEDRKLVYSLMSFDQMVADSQTQLENFTNLYDSFMLLY